MGGTATGTTGLMEGEGVCGGSWRAEVVGEGSSSSCCKNHSSASSCWALGTMMDLGGGASLATNFLLR